MTLYLKVFLPCFNLLFCVLKGDRIRIRAHGISNQRNFYYRH